MVDRRAGSFRHRNEPVGVPVLDFLEVTKPVSDGRWFYRGRRRVGASLASLASSPSVPRGEVLDDYLSLQDDGLEGVRRHASVVLVDEGRVERLSTDAEVQVVDNSNLRIGFAQHGVSVLSGLEEQSAIPVIRRIQAAARCSRLLQTRNGQENNRSSSRPSHQSPRPLSGRHRSPPD